MIAELLSFFSSLDDHLAALAQASLLFFGVVTLIIFAETGLVVTCRCCRGFAAVHRGRDHRARRANTVHLFVVIPRRSIRRRGELFHGSRLGRKAFERAAIRASSSRNICCGRQAFGRAWPGFRLVMVASCSIVRTFAFVPRVAWRGDAPTARVFVYNVIGGGGVISSLTRWSPVRQYPGCATTCHVIDRYRRDWCYRSSSRSGRSTVAANGRPDRYAVAGWQL